MLYTLAGIGCLQGVYALLKQGDMVPQTPQEIRTWPPVNLFEVNLMMEFTSNPLHLTPPPDTSNSLHRGDSQEEAARFWGVVLKKRG
jgi:hypothetical protein